MPTSDEDLQKRAEQVQKLREQVADEEAKRTDRERALANDITMAQLDAEAAQLEARLQVAKNAGKVSEVKSGAQAPLDAAKEQMRVAQAQLEAAKNPDAALDPDKTQPEAAVVVEGDENGKEK